MMIMVMMMTTIIIFFIILLILIIVIIIIVIIIDFSSHGGRSGKKFHGANGIATAGQSALTMFYCYVTDRDGVHVRDERTAVH